VESSIVLRRIRKDDKLKVFMLDPAMVGKMRRAEAALESFFVATQAIQADGATMFTPLRFVSFILGSVSNDALAKGLLTQAKKRAEMMITDASVHCVLSSVDTSAQGAAGNGRIHRPACAWSASDARRRRWRGKHFERLQQVHSHAACSFTKAGVDLRGIP